MNYLAHFVLNHEQRRLPRASYFAMGVALPDLWPRFSRRRRIRWQTVRQTRGQDAAAESLRRGLLNHVAADACFHELPCFHAWQRPLRALLRHGSVHGAVADFLAHVAVELALDHHLVLNDPHLPERFFQCLEHCDPQRVTDDVSRVGGVDACGLADEISAFITRRALSRYADPDVLVGVLHFLLDIVGVTERPPNSTLREVVDVAIMQASPEAVWSDPTWSSSALGTLTPSGQRLNYG